jgi:hypothetical protein
MTIRRKVISLYHAPARAGVPGLLLCADQWIVSSDAASHAMGHGEIAWRIDRLLVHQLFSG